MNAIIIGPSNSGKTSYLASVEHSANVISFHSRHEKGLFFRAFAQNKETQDLFTKALNFLKTGEIPFAGTSISIPYQFSLEYTKEKLPWWRRLFTKSSYKGIFGILDSPGGAVFAEKIDENNPNVQKILEQLRESNGLVICIDCSKAHTISAAQKQELQEFYNTSIQNLLTRSYETEIPYTKISFVMTKSDLYAKNSGHIQDAEDFLHKKNARDLVVHLIGTGVFQTIMAFSPHTDVNFLFSFCSVYGFHNGAIHSNFHTLNTSDWIPFNSVESFAFLLTGEKEHSVQELYSIQEMQGYLENYHS